MKRLRLLSPAKLNLLLKVNFKRPDGYHDLTTLFERIDLCDELFFERTKDGRITIDCQHPHVPRGPGNLVYKAAALLQDKFGICQGVRINLKKNIPVAAGLGGGSGNAAATLLGLNQLWKLGLSKAQLMTLGRTMGSDVPFFIAQSSWAVGTQRGDQIQSLSLKTKLWHVLVVPRLKVHTKDVFGAFLASKKSTTGARTKMLTKPKVNVNILIHVLRKNDVPRIGTLLSNDLETAIVKLHPQLSKLKEKIEKLDIGGVCFSGSGPSVFCVVRSQKQARAVAQSLRRMYARVFVVRTY